MDFFQTIARRHSIRAFKPVEVERDKIDQILEATNRAPSAGDLQAYQVYLVASADRRRAVAHAALGQTFIAQAPLALVFCAAPDRSATKYDQRGRQLYAIQDATIACAYAQLAATALGLASTWVGAFDTAALRTAIAAPEGEVPVAILPIGYAAETPAPAPRRSLDDLVREA
jgi:nitroreductase